MAINKETLKTRSITALVFVIIMLAGLFVNKWLFIMLFSIITLGCLYEFAKIIRLISKKNSLWYLSIALIYIILPMAFMVYLGLNGDRIISNNVTATYQPLIPCAIIFSIWINDTMAYLVGSVIGKTPFSKISPKKTWEGTIGGAIFGIVTMSLVGHYLALSNNFAWYHWAAIAAICAVFGTLGDLLESKLKRLAGVKDSGSFMPGHGGFLDRFDSLLVATPFVGAYIMLLF